MNVKHDFKNDVISILDYDEGELYEPKPKVKEPTPIKNPQLIGLLRGKATIVEPYEGDFIIKSAGTNINNVTNIQYKDYVGRIYGDIFPNFKNFMYYYFDKAIETGEKQKFEVHAYRNDLKFIFSLAIVYEDNQLIVISSREEIHDDDNNTEFRKTAIIQNNKFVKFNDFFSDFLDNNNINKADFTLDYIKDNFKVKYDSTNKQLSLEEIISNTLDNSRDNIIDFYVESKIFNREFYGISRRIMYNDEPAVEVSLISSYNLTENYRMPINYKESDKMLNSKTNTIFSIYDAENKVFEWSSGIYNFLDITPSPTDKYNNIFKDFVFNADLKIINDAHMELAPNSPEVECHYRILKNGEIKYINCRMFAIYDKGENLEKVIYLLNDNTDNYALRKDLQHLQESLNAIQTVNKSALFYKRFDDEGTWTPEIYKILEIEDADKREDNEYDLLMDYVVDENKFNLQNKIDLLSPVNPEGNIVVKIRTEKGNIKYLNIFNKMVYDSFGEEISFISSCFEVTKLKFAQKNNLKLIEAFNDVSNHVKSALFFKDQYSNFIFSSLFSEILGLSTENWFEKDRHTFIENIVNREEYLELYDKFFREEINTVNFEINYKYDGDENQLKIIRYYLHRQNGNISGYIEDITDAKRHENSLKKINEEKSILIKEIHHRVKNNLQIMSSLLNLEERFHKDNLPLIIDSTKKRIASMALIHELAYGSKDLDTVNIREYLETFDSDIFSSYFDNEIKFTNVSDDINISLNIMTPLILIFTELTFNSIKYAFDFTKNENREISKSIIKEGDKCIINYRDNGKGLPEGFDVRNSTGLG